MIGHQVDELGRDRDLQAFIRSELGLAMTAGGVGGDPDAPSASWIGPSWSEILGVLLIGTLENYLRRERIGESDAGRTPWHCFWCTPA